MSTNMNMSMEMIKTNMSPPMNGDTLGTIVEFFIGAEKNTARSAAEGKPVHEEFEFIKISFPGDATKVVERKVNDTDKDRFQPQYEKWKANAREAMTGTPLTELQFLSSAAIADLNYHRVYNVEMLGELTDTAVQNIGMGAMNWRNQAREYLAVAREGADKSLLVKENLELKADMAALQEQVRDLAKRLTEQEDPKGKKSKAD